jgi:hypothetical protein
MEAAFSVIETRLGSNSVIEARTGSNDCPAHFGLPSISV